MENKEINKQNVIEYSNTWKRLVEINEQRLYDTREILAYGRSHLNNECLDYDKETKCYTCKPFIRRGRIHKIKFVKGGFVCNCKRFKKLPKIKGLVCEHILALKLMLKIWNYEKRKDKELGIDII